MSVASVYQTTGDHLNEVIDRMDAAVSAGATTNEQSQPERSTEMDGRQADVNTDADSGDLVALAGVLAAMPLAERAAVLRELPTARRVTVLSVLPDAVKAETLTDLLVSSGGGYQ
ncbi:hypothetical protein JS533_002805 [Bifidobacterium amazonense]|uniref:Magnesium transporter MgtE intracellular domain-containing protein n=1 Tax=Bifidobacterium amazonense TaxID=2809027 RepID=A0ABS9VTF0_9BIFI|nr:hypothetical protein [Bifidobacterium amazonense]MCH9275209.1 hypothetical protein [Bifidobacterium amazonense]